MFSIYMVMDDDFLFCLKESLLFIINDCYFISFKKLVKGDLMYGCMKYDFINGVMFFIVFW